MKPEIWGPAVWNFFHTIACKIKEDQYLNIRRPLFMFIRRICRLLPCPDCANHATAFLAKIDDSKINSKYELINFLFIFHNSVNTRKKKELFKIENINQYSNNSLSNTYNYFVGVFSNATKGNMGTISDTFHRKLLTNDLKTWIINNAGAFNA